MIHTVRILKFSQSYWNLRLFAITAKPRKNTLKLKNLRRHFATTIQCSMVFYYSSLHK